MATHGRTNTKAFRCWQQIHQRCENPKRPNYANYGARGIRVCERWKDFATFLSDMGDPPSPQHSLDRIDNDGPYAPENCRWADMHTQMRNRSDNVILMYRGKPTVLQDIAQECGRSGTTIIARVRRGWSVEEAAWRNGPCKTKHPIGYSS